MPEMRFVVEWPNGATETCYSPSLIIKDYFAEGESYDLEDFVSRARTSLQIASDRVAEKYGFACSAAMDQLKQIEEAAAGFAEVADAKVRCKSFIL
jgi:uncharacterized repeat protein (TIGR04042 family)